MFLIHRRDIVEPVEVRQRLKIGFVFDQLFRTAMEQADMGVDPPHHLAVQFQHKTQHPMCRRVLRPKIDREIAEPSFGHARLVPPLVPRGETLLKLCRFLRTRRSPAAEHHEQARQSRPGTF